MKPARTFITSRTPVRIRPGRLATILSLAVAALSVVALLTLLLGANAPVHAGGPWYVDAVSGDDNDDCLSPATACATIWAAVTLAEDGDTIHIGPGTYMEAMTLPGKDLTFVGAGPHQTFLDGNGSDRVLTLNGINTTLSALTIQNGYVAGSTGGGGIHANGGHLTLQDVILANNVSTTGLGGALSLNGLSNSLAFTLTNVLLQENQAPGGGAIYNQNGAGLLHNVAIANNDTTTADNGALRLWGGETTVSNSTISGNTANGIHITNFGVITLTNSTVAHNEGYGLFTYGSGAMHNSIIAANNGIEANCFLYQPHWTDSLGHNLEDGNSCTFDHAADLTGTDAQLQPLANNGGNTLTHALAAGSPAIDAADGTACPATDQRGVARPQDGNDDTVAHCDIGAFEYVVQGVTAVQLAGPSNGVTNSAYTFLATVQPDTATQPVTYTWEATGHPPLTRQGTITDAITFSWDNPGAKTVTVTAANGSGQVVDSHNITIDVGAVPLTAVTISGPTEGVRDQVYTFTAQATPADATLPITYTWSVPGQGPIVQTGGLTDQIAVSWDADGEYTISVTAGNGHGQANDDHTITLSAYYVSPDGDDGNDCQSAGNACRTIQAAVDRAPAGAIVFIAAGHYSENVTIDHPLTLIGAGASQTIVDGGGSGVVLQLDDGTPGRLAAELHDITLQNGEVGLLNQENLTASGLVVQNNGSNDSGGGVQNHGALVLSASAILNNTALSGAGLFNGSTAQLARVTFHGNSSENTAAVHAQGNGNTTLTNVTISGNPGGPAIVSAGSATVALLNSTVAHNEGGAVANYATVTAQNSLLAYNGEQNCWSPLTSLGHNLEDGDHCGFAASGDLTDHDPLLLPLNDYGGAMLTHALDPAGPAIDAAGNSGCPATDQRGTTRPIDGDDDQTATCDIGAYEYDPASDPAAFIQTFLPFITR